MKAHKHLLSATKYVNHNGFVRKILASVLIFSFLICTPCISLAYDDNKEPIKFTQVSCGAIYSMALDENHDLWMWGGSIYAPDGTMKYYKEPVRMMSDVKYICASPGVHAVIKNDNSLWMWGSNKYGQLGDGTTTDSYTPKKIMDNVYKVALSYCNSAVIKSDKSLWMWGGNGKGQLGTGNTENALSPVKVMDNVSDIALGSSTDDGHSVALKTDGSVWAWGDNTLYQLGTDYNDERCYVPTRMSVNARYIEAGESTTYVIDNSGNLYNWGCVLKASEDADDTTASAEPRLVMNDVKCAFASMLGKGGAVIKNDNTLLYQGYLSNYLKKMDDDVKSADAGELHLAYIKEDGTLWTFGNDKFGQLGNGDISGTQDTPYQIIIYKEDGNENSGSPADSTNAGELSNGGTNPASSDTVNSSQSKLFGVSLTKVIKGKKSFKAKWKKASKKQLKKFSGYQIQYSTSKNFRKNVKTKIITKKGASQVVIRRLKKKTTYYVRLRRFKKSGKTKIYSKWSKVKKVRIK